MALTEAQAYAILIALIRRPGNVDTLADTFRSILEVHQLHFGAAEPAHVDDRPGAPASVYLAAEQKPRARRRMAPTPEGGTAPVAPVVEPVEVPAPSPAAPLEPAASVEVPAPPVDAAPAAPPPALIDWPRRDQGPMPRIAARLGPAGTPKPEPAPELKPLPPATFARLTANGRVLCASCQHGTPENQSELKHVCALKANVCVPQALGKLYSPKK